MPGMNAVSRMMSVGSADRLVVAVQEAVELDAVRRAGWMQDTTLLLAGHDFAAVSVCELRVLGRFGSGGKLLVSAAGDRLVARVSAYREDESAVGFPAGLFGRVDAAARGAVLEWEPLAVCQPARERVGGDGMVLVSHLLAAPAAVDADDDWRPLVCGAGVTLPGPVASRQPDCMSCRWGAAAGCGVWRWLCELADLLSRLDVKASFPRSRRTVLTRQRSVLAEALVSPRAGMVRSVVEQPGWLRHAGVNPWVAEVSALVAAFAEWNWQVLAAHRGSSSRFPAAAETDEMLAAGRQVGLGVR